MNSTFELTLFASLMHLTSYHIFDSPVQANISTDCSEALTGINNGIHSGDISAMSCESVVSLMTAVINNFSSRSQRCIGQDTIWHADRAGGQLWIIRSVSGHSLQNNLCSILSPSVEEWKDGSCRTTRSVHSIIMFSSGCRPSLSRICERRDADRG